MCLKCWELSVASFNDCDDAFGRLLSNWPQTLFERWILIFQLHFSLITSIDCIKLCIHSLVMLKLFGRIIKSYSIIEYHSQHSNARDWLNLSTDFIFWIQTIYHANLFFNKFKNLLEMHIIMTGRGKSTHERIFTRITLLDTVELFELKLQRSTVC